MRRQKDAAVIFDTFDIKVDEYQVAGDFGWARGIYTIVTHPRAGGEAATDVGTFLTVFHKQADGSWRVYRDTMMTLPK
jgi:ketosteroid isomerase-like protein